MSPRDGANMHSVAGWNRSGGGAELAHTRIHRMLDTKGVFKTMLREDGFGWTLYTVAGLEVDAAPRAAAAGRHWLGPPSEADDQAFRTSYVVRCKVSVGREYKPMGLDRDNWM